MYPKSLNELIESFKYFPGIGEKTAERLAFSVLDFDEEKIELFSNSLKNIKKNISLCSICNSFVEDDNCLICNDKTRDRETLCIVEDAKNVFLIEKLQVYKGLYHVINGLISPLDGVNPEDIGLDKLIERVKNENFKEIIFAFKPSIEGETTALYVKKLLEGLDIKITRLASGVPIGADMEYIDTLTLERALNDRKLIS